MEDLMNFSRLLTRQFAHPFDRPVKTPNDNETHGVGRNSDAIGGYNGIGWYETFRDRKSGELYRVRCSDGVNGGKSAHTDEDCGWIERCRREIIKRTKHEAESGVNSISISSEEWAVMLNFTFTLWLDNVQGQKSSTVGDLNCHLDDGQIGTINGVPVIVVPSLEDGLQAPRFDGR
jgi:hypothetical protein